MAVGHEGGLPVTPLPAIRSAGTNAPHFVAASEFSVPLAVREALDVAFASRMGAVHRWHTFRGLQVLADASDPCTLMMISWWDNEDCFASSMRSEDHRLSHRRIPKGEYRPCPHQFRRFEVVAQ